ncbi:type II toxin-antitoxin system VapC family toxin [Granulicella mallensis]|uniref:Ribonuclease VapC n=1 Tax=Granulicella mallensis (strain ATCC BAA-1857 / DSM 23137 / MP5ACTX8) TaxID=682795 RepID=G8NZW3_GRAMM|nr:type II toxin-antitoxin system VapC family toxin [Granulicella mallensis]AEU34590.1 PilT protein domain protein [Granulicella mallensis MP5ACTX8]
MSYLLDTTTCVELFSGANLSISSRLRVELARSAVFVSSVVFFEIWYGVHKSKRIEQNRPRTARLLSMGIELLDFTGIDAEAAGHIRATLEARKQPIGPYDTLIAGQALARGLTLVTANHREFARVDGLQWEDWAQE